MEVQEEVPKSDGKNLDKKSGYRKIRKRVKTKPVVEKKPTSKSHHFATKAQYLEFEKKHPFATCDCCKKEFDRRLRGGRTRGKLKRLVQNLFRCLKCSRQNFVAKCKDFTCDHCGFYEKRRKRFVTHMAKHMILSCNACKEVITTQNLLMAHLQAHFSMNNVCAICGETFSNVFRFYKHKIRAHREGKKPLKTHPCSFCEKPFESKATRDVHEKRDHPNGQLGFYKCKEKECKEEFNTKKDLTEHSYTHYTGEVFNCDFPECTFKHKESWKLKQHMLVHSLAKDAFPCKKCDQAFKFKHGLERHIKEKRCKAVRIPGWKKPEDQEKMARIAKQQFDLAKSWKPMGGGRRKSKKQVDDSSLERMSDDESSSDEVPLSKIISKLPVEAAPEVQAESYDQEESSLLIKATTENQSGEHCEIVYIKPEPGEVDIVESPSEIGVKEEPEEVPTFCEEVESIFAKLEPEAKVNMQPVVMLKHLESDEILRWTEWKIKFEVCSDVELPIEKVKSKKTNKKSYTPKTTRTIQRIRFAGGTSFTCDMCGVTIAGKKIFAKHVKQHFLKWSRPTEVSSTKQPIRLACDSCSRHFRCKYDLVTHYESTHGHRAEPQSCKFCKKVLRNWYACKQHEMKQHSRSKVICEQCGLECPNKYYLSTHRQTHRVKETCKICGNSVKRIDLHLKMHKKTKNE